MRLNRLVPAAIGPAVISAFVVTASGGAANAHANYHAVCPGPGAAPRCHVNVVTDSRGNPDARKSPSGVSPATTNSPSRQVATSTVGVVTTACSQRDARHGASKACAES